MDAEFEGLEEFQRELESFADRAEALEGEQEVPLEELLTPSFLRRHSTFTSLEEMFGASGWNVESEEDFEAIPEDEWDAFIAENTNFPNWQSMLRAATQKWAVRQLGLEGHGRAGFEPAT